MAAWAPKERGKPSEVIGRIGHSENLRVSTPAATLPTPCPNCNRATIGECGCLESAEPTGVEAFPVEVWEFFDDAALDQLITEAAVELGRRELVRLENA